MFFNTNAIDVVLLFYRGNVNAYHLVHSSANMRENFDNLKEYDATAKKEVIFLFLFLLFVLLTKFVTCSICILVTIH